MPKYRFRRLARDKMVEWLEARDHVMEYTRVSGEDFAKELRNKIIEEADEVKQAKSREELIEEVGDVLDILDAICKQAGITSEEVAASQKAKFDERGAYNRVAVDWCLGAKRL